MLSFTSVSHGLSTPPCAASAHPACAFASGRQRPRRNHEQTSTCTLNSREAGRGEKIWFPSRREPKVHIGEKSSDLPLQQLRFRKTSGDGRCAPLDYLIPQEEPLVGLCSAGERRRGDGRPFPRSVFRRGRRPASGGCGLFPAASTRRPQIISPCLPDPERPLLH